MSCSSATMVTIALTFVFTRWIRCRCACITSRDESFLERIASTISTARMKQISSPELGVAVFDSMAVADGPRATESAVPVPSLIASRRVIVLLMIPLRSRMGRQRWWTSVSDTTRVSVSWSRLPDNVLLSSQPAWTGRGSRPGPKAVCKWYPHQRRCAGEIMMRGRATRQIGGALLAIALALFCAGAAHAAGLCDAGSYGAKADGTTKDTLALQKAIDGCAGKGGGTVRLARGTFLSGPIVLKSHIALEIDPGATLRGSQDKGDYPPVREMREDAVQPLISATNAQDVAIRGRGTIH